VPELIDELKTLPGATMKQFGEEIGNNPATAFSTQIRANLQGPVRLHCMRSQYVWFGYRWKACGESRGEGTAA
jgi:hypothetical protein